MANGVAALHLVSEPASDPRQEEIGAATAAAATMIACAIEDCRQGGSLAPATKAVGADRLTKVAMLMLAHEGGDDDFIATAHRAGKEILRQRLNGAFSPEAADGVLDFYISGLFEIVTRTVAVERAYRAAAAH